MSSVLQAGQVALVMGLWAALAFALAFAGRFVIELRRDRRERRRRT